MFCNQCGQQIEDGAMFCPGCGAKQQVEPAPAVAPVPEAAPMPQMEAVPTPMAAAPAKESILKKTVKVPVLNKELPLVAVAGVGLVAVILVLVLLISIVSKIRGGKAFSVGKSMNFYRVVDEGIVNKEGVLYDEFEYSEIDQLYYSVDDSTVLFRVYEDDALYYLTPNMQAVHIADNVYQVKISMDGKMVAYTVREDETADCELYVYSIKDQTSTEIDDEVHGRYICISPNGKTIAYLKDYESSTDNTLYLGGLNKEAVKVDKDGCYPLAVSDNGKNFYYVNEASGENKLYVYDGKNSEKIATNVDINFWFNNSITEVLYTKNEKTYYYSPKLKEPAKISNTYMYAVVAPYDVISYSSYDSDIKYVAKDSFKNTVVNTYNGLAWINEKATDSVKIAYAESYVMSEDGQSLVFVKGYDLCKLDKFTDKMEYDTLYSEDDVYRVIANADLSKIYIVTEEDELLYVKGENKTERISNDVSTWDPMAINEATGKICYVEDGDLYTAGKDAKSRTEIASDVDTVYAVANGIYYVVDDGDEEALYYLEKKVVELYVYE